MEPVVELSKPMQPLGDQAFVQIRARIMNCSIAPGATVSERSLATDLGFGIATIRAALVRLVGDGLVEVVPRVGYRVRPITLRTITDFFDAWELIAPPLVRLAVARLGPEHRDRLAALPTVSPAASAEDVVEAAEAFFDVLVGAANNPTLTDIYRRLNLDNHRLFVFMYRSPAPYDPPLLPVTFEVDEAEAHVRTFVAQFRRRVLDRLLTASSLADVEVRFD